MFQFLLPADADLAGDGIERTKRHENCGINLKPIRQIPVGPVDFCLSFERIDDYLSFLFIHTAGSAGLFPGSDYLGIPDGLKATRKPPPPVRNGGVPIMRYADRQNVEPKNQLPPRDAWFEPPFGPSGSTNDASPLP